MKQPNSKVNFFHEFKVLFVVSVVGSTALRVIHKKMLPNTTNQLHATSGLMIKVTIKCALCVHEGKTDV